ncbi:MAG TPA: c-type cytochrome domain-containing protein [Verrucomicrobiae bacterium]|jgi:hypothetical protein|nr:c-type cytochrome domain-containing protein [Verrucomicrobiae bacterium]
MNPLSTAWFALAMVCGLAAGVEAQEKPLPPAATGSVDFARDIEPILKNSCLRCHGSEKPKSHFRLDNRVSALAGGEKNTNDIVPGDSGKSLLIHYVAYAVGDVEMPPIGKGEQLTPRQIGLLRAWIDRGANWGTNEQASSTSFVAAPVVGGINVQGNKGKFRELEGTTDGVSGGLQKFSYTEHFGPNEKLSIEGHALEPQEDLSLKLSLDKTDTGFVRMGFEQWRKYYGADGGFDPAVMPSEFTPNRNLYLDNGHAWVDFGIDSPRLPQMALGYEYQFRTGMESTLDWGYAGGKNIYSATQAIDERTHILKFDATNEISGWHFEDSARAEFYTEKNQDQEAEIFSGAVPNEFVNTRDDYHHVQGMNTLTFEKAIRDGWLLTGGFYYSRLEGSDLFNQTFNGAGGLSSQQITLGRDSEIFSGTSLFTPLEYFTFSLGTQNEWTRENGFGASVPDLELGVNTPADSSLDEFKATQQANFRFTKIPYTVVSGEAESQEESVSEYQMEDPAEFMRDTAANNHLYNFKAGFNTSPWRAFEWSADFRGQDSSTDYGQLLDIFKYYGLNSRTNGYPAFILNRDIRSDVFETKLVWHPARWIKTTMTYQITSTDYSSKTDPFIFSAARMELLSAGVPILDGTYDAQNYGFGVTVTPVRRLYFSGAFTYSLSRAITADNGDPSIVPYRGNIYMLNAAATYALGPKSAVQAAYNFSRADYGENNAAAGVPLGLDYTHHDLSLSLTRKFNAQMSGSLRYTFSEYSEPSSGNANNYLANGVFCAITYKLH